MILDDFVSSIVFESRDEEDTGLGPSEEELKIIVTTVYRDDAAGGKRKMAGSGDIGSLAIGDHGEVWQIAVVIQKEMELNSTLGLTEVSPRKQTEAKVDRGSVKAEQLVFETEFSLLTGILAAADVPQIKEELLIKLPGTVGIGIGKRALGRGITQSQMSKFATGDGQTIADLPQALGLSKLAEDHGDILTPGRKPLGVTFRPTFMDHL